MPSLVTEGWWIGPPAAVGFASLPTCHCRGTPLPPAGHGRRFWWINVAFACFLSFCTVRSCHSFRYDGLMLVSPMMATCCTDKARHALIIASRRCGREQARHVLYYPAPKPHPAFPIPSRLAKPCFWGCRTWALLVPVPCRSGFGGCRGRPSSYSHY